ncbi:MAG: TonB-dependent receptor [Alphaproteobacteria bacterium]|nr:TonB-dependent receptor [Alphaproteobacteria bacterium]
MCLAASGVAAQEVAQAGRAAILIEEIQVYGTKKNRAEQLQDVPLAVSAFSESALDTRQLITIEDLSFASPNVSLDQVGTTPGVQNFSIRGLGINSSIPSVDPTVGLFVDGVYLGMTAGVVVDTFDLESIEILRGPQGLLFGRNVTGGAVLLRSKRPTGEFGAKAKISYETGPQYTASAAVEGPIAGDKLAGKLSVYYKDDDGYFDNLADPNRDVGAQQTLMFRPSFVFTPSDALELTLIYEHGDLDGDGAVGQRALSANPSDVSDNIFAEIDEPGFVDIKWDQVTFEANWEVGPGTLTNIFGYRKVKQNALSDVDASPLLLFHGDIIIDQDQISNELRYFGELTDQLDVTAGLYYFDQDVLYRENRYLAFNTIIAGLGGDQAHKNYGAFLSADYRVTDAFTVTAGARYTEEKKTANVSRFGFCDVTTLVCAPDFSDSEKWTNVTPKIGVRWDATENAMMYAHWTKGFRSGGYNFRTTVPAIFDAGPTDEEKQDSFEVGFKSSWMDRQFVLNGSAFYNDLKDLQRELNVANPIVGVVQGLRNTADATIKGFELDMVALPVPQLAFNASIGYLDGSYDEVRFDLSSDGVIDAADLALSIPRLPKWTYTVGSTFDQELGDFAVLSLRGEYSHRGKTFFTDNNIGTLPAYDVFNASISLISMDEQWALTFYGKNLSDEAIVQQNTTLPFGQFGAPRLSTLQEGRRWGLELKYQY